MGQEKRFFCPTTIPPLGEVRRGQKLTLFTVDTNLLSVRSVFLQTTAKIPCTGSGAPGSARAVVRVSS